MKNSYSIKRVRRLGACALLLALQACGGNPNSIAADEDEIVASTGATIENASTFEIIGPEGGPFPQGTRTYRLRNDGDELLVWDMDTTIPWLVAEPNGGILNVGQETAVVVEIDHDQAGDLVQGSYPADLVLRSRTNVEGVLFLGFQLTVEAPPSGELVINPQGEMTIEVTADSNNGQVDGTLAVSNTGSASLEWEAFAGDPWITVHQPDGNTLAAGENTSLELSVDKTLLQSFGFGSHHTQITVGPVGEPSANQVIELEVILSETGDARVRQGLIAEYLFEEASGSIVNDLSGQSPAMNLVIQDTSNVDWVTGGLHIHSPTVLATAGPATRLTQRLVQTGEVTVEAWLRPSHLNQDGPARLMGISNGPSLRNFTLGQGLWGSQPKDTFNMRLRSTSTDLDGMPLLSTPSGAANAALQHVVYTRSANGQARLFVDGQVVGDTQLTGDFSNWDASYRLAVANEIGANRPWVGEMYLLAMYDRALTASEVDQNRNVGSGASMAGHLSVSPQSEIQINAVVGESPSGVSSGFDLSNLGGESLQWTASVDQTWVALSQSQGSLGPNQEGVADLVLDGAQIANLAVGTYTAVANFVNQTNGLGSTSKTLRLTIQTPATPGDGERPGPSNTGPTNSSILQNISGMTITQDGFVLENVRVSGPVNIEANNVTIRNFIIDGGESPYAIRAIGGHSGILIEDGELINVSSAHIYGGGFTARRLNLHESGGDGFKCTENVVVEDCWVHHLGMAPGAHADCNQTRSGSHFVFRRNFFDLPIDIGSPYKQNAAFIMQTGAGPVDDILIEDNWLTGGNFTVYITNKWSPGSSLPNYGDPTNARLINNRFGREYRYGVLSSTGEVYISGNRWDDNGELMTINNN